MTVPLILGVHHGRVSFLVVRGIDLLAVAAAVAVMGSLGLYLAVISSQDTGGPATWAVVVLLLAAVLCLAAAPVRVPQRAAPLLLASVMLGGLGVLAIFSVGLLFMLAASFAFAAFLQAVL